MIMKTNTTKLPATPETDEKPGATPTPEVIVTDEAAAEQEANAFLGKVIKLSEEGANLKPLAVRHLAKRLGATSNSLGRPTEAHFTAFMLAMGGRKVSLAGRVELANLANKESPHRRTSETSGKTVGIPFKLEAKGNSIEGKGGFKLALPATYSVDIG
jgi:hypothetical protein